MAAGPLLLLNGTRHVTVTNISLHYADWSFRTMRDGMSANKTSGSVQEASFLPSAALQLTNTSHCTVDGVAIEHVGEDGIWVEGGAVYTTIRNTLVNDVGGSGIRVGRGKPLDNTPDGTAFASISDTTVVHGGRVFPGAGGIVIQKTSHNLVEHCEVAYFHAHGISVGWTWDYRSTEANHNVVRDNHVHHLGNGVPAPYNNIIICTIIITHTHTNTHTHI